MVQITLSLFIAMLITSCTSSVKKICENNHAYYFPGHNFDERYEEFNKKCQSSYNITVNKEEYKKSYEKSRKEHDERLIASCNCESGFTDESKARQKNPTGSLSHQIKKCELVNKKDAYQKGIELAKQKQTEVDSKRGFWDKLWYGPTPLTIDDAKNSCRI